MLHTLPLSKASTDSEAGVEMLQVEKQRKFPQSVNDIPRLISIAEIIKREFATLVSTNKAGVGNPPGTVLYQYNMMSHREEDGHLPQDEGTDELLLALDGKN